MQYYFAPLEGLTDSIYRQIHQKYFPGVDRYYTPFFSPTVHRRLTPKEARELPSANCSAVETIPQLLTKVPEDFIWMTGVCADLGYREVNLNLGCPSGTVTAKGKGAGMLRDPDSLDRFLHAIFSGAAIPISVKTRVGFDSADEFPALLEILNRYPIKELTVHPRVRNAFYNGAVDMDAFAYAAKHSRAPICFNGNLCTKEQIASFANRFPDVCAVMLGRGLIGNPGMFSPNGTEAATLENFHCELLEGYRKAFGSARNAMFRMKENWRYLICLFEGGEKLGKRLRKTTDIAEYLAVTHEIIHNLPMRETLQADW